MKGQEQNSSEIEFGVGKSTWKFIKPALFGFPCDRPDLKVYVYELGIYYLNK